jgi:fatty-acyl-CoA synthase
MVDDGKRRGGLAARRRGERARAGGQVGQHPERRARPAALEPARHVAAAEPDVEAPRNRAADAHQRLAAGDEVGARRHHLDLRLRPRRSGRRDGGRDQRPDERASSPHRAERYARARDGHMCARPNARAATLVAADKVRPGRAVVASRPPMSAPAVAHPDHHAEADPGRLAYRMEPGGEEVAYGRLVDASRAIAGLLRERGVGRGDAVAILIENHPRFMEVAWAAQRSGLRYTAISTRLTSDEVAYILRDSGAVALFTSARCAEVARAAADAAPGVATRLCVDGAVGGFEALDPPPAGPHLDDAEGADLLYSSGTTGRPKGVVADLPLTPLGTTPAIAGLLQSRWGFGEDTVYLSPAPLYHAAPLRFNMTVHRFGGRCVVMERFDPLAALELIERHRITHAQMVPTMFIRMLKLPEQQRGRFDLSSLRAVIHAAAPCPVPVKRAMIDWFGPVIHEYYSSTEADLFTVIGPEEALERPGSVGRAILGTPHILGEDGHELPAGEPGTIWSEGGLPFAYLNDPDKTAAARNDRGWTTIGDIGYLDADGYLYLTDRKADMVISGGVNIYPQEAESVLVTHPKVADVAVFGVPNEDLGEEVRAVVQPMSIDDAGEELAADLLAFCQERLAKYKCPRGIDFRAELPRHPTGKLYKRLLRDEYAGRG